MRQGFSDEEIAEKWIQPTQAQKIREEEGRGCVQSMQFGLDVLTVEALSSAEEIQVCGSLRKLNFSQCGWCCSHRKLRENKKKIEKIGKDSYRIKRDSNLREMISSCFLSGCSKPCHSVVFDCEMSLSYFFLTRHTADIPSMYHNVPRQSSKLDFIETLRTMPIAICTTKANEQHYEVPF